MILFTPFITLALALTLSVTALTPTRSGQRSRSFPVSHAAPRATPFGAPGGTKCGAGIGRCPDNLCCSQWGWCDSGEDFCGAGCQPDYGSCDHTPGGTKCGAGIGRCPGNLCCSQWGWCDVGKDFCGAGCQLDYGRCDAGGGDQNPPSPVPPPGPPAHDIVTECTVPGMIAMTFDDGPWKFTSTLLDLLKRYRIQATFFVNGDNFDDASKPEWQAVIRRAFNEGHQIGSHGFKHQDLTKLSPSAAQDEIRGNESIFRSAIGHIPRFFRPPYGAYNPDVLQILASLGYDRAVNWNVDTDDWTTKSAQKSAAAWIDAIGKADRQRKGLIVLEHDTLQSTAEQLVPLVADRVRQMGWRFGTVAECIGEKGAEYQA